MSKVKKRNVVYPYVNLSITKAQKNQLQSFICNLKKVYIYIGSDDDVKNLGEDKVLGRAYHKIFTRLNPNKYHIYYQKISKRQIKQLLKYHWSVQGYYIKIPYLIDYIFKAVFELVRIELDSGRDLPVEVCKFVGDIRRNDFYLAQSSIYKEYCKDNTEEMTQIKEDLDNDINGEKASLAKKFI